MRFFGTLSAISVPIIAVDGAGTALGPDALQERAASAACCISRTVKLIDAEVGRLRGEDALQRVLTWNDGEYRVDQLTVLRPDRIPMSSSALLLEAAKWVDEWNGLPGCAAAARYGGAGADADWRARPGAWARRPRPRSKMCCGLQRPAQRARSRRAR